MKKILLVASLVLAFIFTNTSPITQNEPTLAQATSKYYFKNNVAKIKDVKVKITKVDFYTKEQALELDNFNPCIVFYYTTTNLTGNKAVTPIAAWDAIFKVQQGKSEIWYGGNPSNTYAKTMFKTIKKGKSVKNAVIFTMDDATTPIVLRAYNGTVFDYLGKKTYKVKF